jgi:hypothetical protein
MFSRLCFQQRYILDIYGKTLHPHNHPIHHYSKQVHVFIFLV